MLFQTKILLDKYLIKIHKIFKKSYGRGEGIIIHYLNSGEIILENTILKREVLIRNKNKFLVNIQPGDIDFDKVDKLENPQNAHILLAEYRFTIWGFKNGVAPVWWTLYPDGRYFEDEDGYGGESCNETRVYAFIDTLGKVIIPFQDMNSEEEEQFKLEAEQKVRNRSIQNNYQEQ